MKTTLPYPNLVIAGAPKCGTSSLYFWLAQHPDACASTLKETFFLADSIQRFNTESSFINDGLAAYPNHFKQWDGEKVVFEATAPYIYYNTPLAQLPKLNPVPKIAFILREPAKRLYSKFIFNKFKLKNFSGSFAEYISNGEEKFGGRHFDEGKYSDYLNKWVDVFGRKNIYIMILEDVVADQKAEMKRFSSWLGIDPAFYDTFDFSKRNETFGVRSTKMHRLGLKLQPLVPYKLQEALIPLYQRINGTAIPKISHEEIRLVEELKNEYASKNKELAALFQNLSLSRWK